MSTLGVTPVYIRKPQELAIVAKTIATWCQFTKENLLVVDDCSPNKELLDKLVEFIEPYPQVDISLRDSNGGFAAAVNVGLRKALANGQDAVLVNSDIEFLHPEWLDRMQENDAWVVGALLLYPNRTIQHAGIYYSVITRSFDHIFRHAPGNLATAAVKRTCPVTGALQLIRHDALKTIGLYDENFRMGWEDVSYCTDVFVAGQQCVYEPRALAVHHESVFRGRNKNKKIANWELESWDYLHRKHAGVSFADWCPTLIDEGAWE